MTYDIIIIGAGHAGIEAASAASRMGCSVLLLTLSRKTVGLMSCNPAIGGVGKGQLVKEVDALGGEMAHAADACGMQFRILNASKGCAVHSSRAQVDMYLYQRWMKRRLAEIPNLTLKEDEVTGILIEGGAARGVTLAKGGAVAARCVVAAAGTFLDGVIHVGLRRTEGGRINEPSARDLTRALGESGFRLKRFKTGTCPRLAAKSILWEGLTPQPPDKMPQPFSYERPGGFPQHPQISCYITHTTGRTHKIIRDNLDRSPLYTGVIEATGVRYCPSIEDKLVRFPGKPRHQVFLEPQGYAANEVYPNGLSTSLPEDVQEAMIRTIPGLEKARIVRFGYGIEHTVIEATQLYPTLESKIVSGLYSAGQLNGTTGYEEAAAQGLVAGINAALRVQGREPCVFDRSSSYIGVLIDDLTTKGTEEPYRMFTSRVEYRLLIREDNADLRLSDIGYELGLLDAGAYDRVRKKRDELTRAQRMLRTTRIKPSRRVNDILSRAATAPIRRSVTLSELLKRPQVCLETLREMLDGSLGFCDSLLRVLETEIKYEGFIRRQIKGVNRFKHLEYIRLSPALDYTLVPGLSREIQEKLTEFRPLNLGQASRISGVTPAAVCLLMVYLRKHEEKGKKRDVRPREA
ncbi:MAG: tRNA uridine-5-carboxymethylaminomethyl(34) synthesis enzyme MnmG [Candidatus Omnitrophica bacterium]|nr:tRNA uridine-5-carboxymethylaminomethyl(34) synthesis enzyme MnmG [Candidatus Omnitrophota bacterium]